MQRTALAFLIGGAIRYNITHGEPLFVSADTGHPIKSIETLSHLVLIGAYFISVAYYLVLLAAFGLKLSGWSDPTLGEIIATVIISGICFVGATKGLEGVEKAEKVTVSTNLAAIAALIATLIVFGIALPADYTWGAPAKENHTFD